MHKENTTKRKIVVKELLWSYKGKFRPNHKLHLLINYTMFARYGSDRNNYLKLVHDNKK